MLAKMDFHWAVKNELAVGSLPATRADASRLLQNGIRAVLSLHPMPYSVRQALEREGMAVAYRELTDLSAPAFDEMREMEELIRGWRQEGRPVYVHCYLGVGRSRTVASAYLAVEMDCCVEEAFELAGRPQTARQREFVKEYLMRARAAGG